MERAEVIIEFGQVALVLRYIESVSRVEIEGKKLIEIHMQSGRVHHMPDVKQNWNKILNYIHQYQQQIVLL